MEPQPSSPHRDPIGLPAAAGTRPHSVLRKPDHGATTAPVNELIVSRLEALLDRLRPAARLRPELGELDAELLNAAASVCAARRATAATCGTTR